MARNPLYPRSAGETAVDRLLNQTLPRIIKDKQDRDDRAQQRQDTLDARAQQQENFNKQFTYGVEQDALKESNRKDEKVSNHFSKATSYAMVGKYEEAESEYQNGLFWAGKWGLSHKDYGSETSRIKIDKVRTTNNTYDTAIGVFNSSMSSPDSILSAGKSVMGVWGDLSDKQKVEYLQIVKDGEDNQNFAMLTFDRNELEFFDKNSKLYSSTLGKKSGFANLTESQREEFEAKLPTELQYLGPDATEAQLKRREQELTKLYQSSDLYTSEQEFAKKYVNDTVNMYGGNWDTASEIINSMTGFNRDEHISRLALGLVKGGEVKASEIEKNLLEKGISEEAINASGLFKEAPGDGDEDGDEDGGKSEIDLDNFENLSPEKKVEVFDKNEEVSSSVSGKMDFLREANREYDRLILKRSKGITLNDEEVESLRKSRAVIDSVPENLNNISKKDRPANTRGLASKVRASQLRGHLEDVEKWKSRIKQLETAIKENKTYTLGHSTFLEVPGQDKYGVLSEKKTLSGYKKELQTLKKSLEKSPKTIKILERRLQEAVNARDPLKNYDLIDVKNEQGQIINQFLRKK